MTSKFDVFKKIALVLFLNFLTFFVVIQLQGNLDQANAATTTNSTDYASIVSKTSINKTATILDSKRNDGVYFSGPALTSVSTMTANASGNSYNGDTVTIEEINLTKRSNGIEYTYAEVYDSTPKKLIGLTRELFWLQFLRKQRSIIKRQLMIRQEVIKLILLQHYPHGLL